MESRRRFFVGVALAVLGGAVAGLAIGGFAGFRFGMTSMLKDWVYKDARDVQKQLIILRHLRAGEGDRAIELLEARLDDQLIPFDPWQPYPGLTGREKSEMNRAIGEAKEYRLAYPRKSSRPHVDEMVRNVFSREPYK